MTIQEYVSKLNSRYISGISIEHSYRGDLQNLLESLVSAVMVTNEPSRVAWDFYIGGYQPAQKWLKERKGRALNFEDILHYQKIIVALSETAGIMMDVDKILVE
jgi:Type ISP C-terminal specificity domain